VYTDRKGREQYLPNAIDLQLRFSIMAKAQYNYITGEQHAQ